MSLPFRSALAQSNGRVRLMEAHDGTSEDNVRRAVGTDNQASFHGLWISSLTQTTRLGIPDSELISPWQRASLIDFYPGAAQDSKCRRLCAAFDADSGGPAAEIPALVATLTGLGIGMVVIEDKEMLRPGDKVNSLSNSASQRQVGVHEFARTIQTFKAALERKDLIVTARIESLTTRAAQSDAAAEKLSVQAALDEALARSDVYRDAGADAIMIHSKSEQPDEVLSFLRRFRAKDLHTPLVVVPTAYSRTPEDDLYNAGANVVIYANHLMRAKIKACEDISQAVLTKQLDLFPLEPEFDVCLRAQNFGCLVSCMERSEKLTREAEAYLAGLEAAAAERMKVVATRLLDTKTSCGADEYLISVKELLDINSRQISYGLGVTAPVVQPHEDTDVPRVAETNDGLEVGRTNGYP
ncbi:hypothetical protein CDD83_3864 [Cordyceps sp. RAO-2017]|nr:hypothetical protein CDD83_3864 [Cordyceps sp. RAO-2017]